MESTYDRLVIIDTDIVFAGEQLEFLLSHDAPFVAGLYPKKQRQLEWPAAFLGDKNPFDDHEALEENPLVEMEWVARGFTCMHRSVFETVAKEPGIPMWEHDTGRHHPEWWQLEPGGHSEDLNFCRRYRSLGGRVMVDSRCIVRHEGSIVYPLT